MANENGEVQQSSNNEDDIIAAVEVTELVQHSISTDEGASVAEEAGTAAVLQSKKNNIKNAATQDDKRDEQEETDEDESGCQRMKLNDLVADLCLNRTSEEQHPDGIANERMNNEERSHGSTLYLGPISCKMETAMDNPVSSFAKAQQPPVVQMQPSQNSSSFSFKHFLNSSNTMTAPSSTITALGVNVTTSSTTTITNSLQTSTGARPKVPQSTSASTSSISSLISGLGVGDGHDTSSATKMKRSPRFSSFDSQASLAEYTIHGTGCGVEEAAVLGVSTGYSTRFRGLCADALGEEGNDIFKSRHSTSAKTNMCAGSGSDYDGRYVTHSQSNYDMPRQSASPRRRMGMPSSKESRPTRLSLNTNSAKLKLDLPIDSAASTSAAAAVSSSSRPLPNNSGEFPTIAAAVLPDFVQDHWMDSWYAHEMHLNSPPNSPIRGFMDEIAGAGAIAMDIGASGAMGGGGGAVIADNNSGNEPPPAGSSKMLPDFLSDGPIIHSSQRLADVAAGLPSNSIGSPEDVAAASQLTNLRNENERLQRELNEVQSALNEQTRRANELERQCQEMQRADIAHSRTMSQNITQAEESVDKSRRQAVAAQSHVVKLKQQVTQLTAEVETLRRENESLREEGAVGGYSTSSCDRSFGAAAASTPNVRTHTARPSKSQQLSRELLKAASNAENNLRQLLNGVDNLRQMAAELDNSKARFDLDESTEQFSEFLEDCDDLL